MVSFWKGTSNGSAIDDRYTNWGSSEFGAEPDNFGIGQDGLGLALSNWPLGSAGQWNDLGHSNTLYYIIEYTAVLGTSDFGVENQIKMYPNPFKDFVTIESEGLNITEIVVSNSIGQEEKKIETEGGASQRINLSNLGKGVYFIKVSAANGQSITRKFVK